MTVGKIYCAKLMWENYKQIKKRRQFAIIDDNNSMDQKSSSIFRRLVRSVSRSMRQRRSPSSKGLVSSEKSEASLVVDGPIERSFHHLGYVQIYILVLF